MGLPVLFSSDSAGDRGRFGAGLLVLLAYVGLAIWWLWPLPTVWRNHAVDIGTPTGLTGADFDLIAWALAWSSHALTHPGLALFDAPIFVPAPGALAFSEHALGYLPLFAPIFLWTGNAVFAANLTLFVTFPLCGVATYAWMRRFTSRPAAFSGGLVFAFCSIRYDALWHFHLLGTFWMPLALLLTERFFERARAWDAIALCIVLTLQLLASYYLAYALIILYLPYLLLSTWHWRASLDRRRIVGWALSCLTAGGIFLLVSLPYLALREADGLPDYSDGSARLAGVMKLAAMRFVSAYAQPSKVGWAVLGLALLGAIWPLRGTSHARRIALLVLVVGLLLSMGSRPVIAGWHLPTPYPILVEFLPGFQTIRGPWRFLVVAQLGIAMLVALGVGRVWSLRHRAVRASLLLIALGVFAVRLQYLPPLNVHAKPDVDALPPVYEYLADQGGAGPLLEVPLSYGPTAATRMLYGTKHWIPMLSGYSGYPPPTLRFFDQVVSGLPKEAALQRLVDLIEIEWILVHLDMLSPKRQKRWRDELPEGLVRVGPGGRDLLFRVVREPRRSIRPDLFSTTETADGNPRASVGAHCPGRIEVVSLSKLQAQAGRRLAFRVELVNESDRIWPAFGVFGEGLVRIEATLLFPSGQKASRPASVYFDRDVEPGARATGLARLRRPQGRRTNYELEVAAFQGERPLAECGLEPLRIPVSLKPVPPGKRKRGDRDRSS